MTVIFEHASAIRRRAETVFEQDPSDANLRALQDAGAQEMDIYLAGFDARHNRNVTLLPDTPVWNTLAPTAKPRVRGGRGQRNMNNRQRRFKPRPK